MAAIRLQRADRRSCFLKLPGQLEPPSGTFSPLLPWSPSPLNTLSNSRISQICCSIPNCLGSFARLLWGKNVTFRYIRNGRVFCFMSNRSCSSFLEVQRGQNQWNIAWNWGKLEQAQRRGMKLEKPGEASRRFKIGTREGGNSRTTNSRLADCLRRSKPPKKLRKYQKI